MFLLCRTRKKDGKIHRNWSVVENHRAGKRIIRRHVLYLGELNDSQHRAWVRTLAVFDQDSGDSRQLALFPEQRPPSASQSTGLAPETGHGQVRVRLDLARVKNPRQWGACFLADSLYRELRLDGFFAARLGKSREGTEWEKILRILVIYRLLAPGSEWRLHRHWFNTTALRDLLGVDESAAQDDTLYRCHDLLLAHKQALFKHLHQRWADLFGARYDILLYDLTSTYFECEAPADENDPRKFGYSRDRRGDCVQVVIALIVTPEGLPIAYEMLPGNTSDKTTLAAMIALVQARYGAAQRVWVMDRGIPTEETLAMMRVSNPPIHYLVGTTKARLGRLEASLCEQPFARVREELRVKNIAHEGETYIYVESAGRVNKERSMRRRALRAYLKRLRELSALKRPLTRDEMHVRLGKAQEKAGRLAASLVEVDVTSGGQIKTRFNMTRLREAWRREGRYLLRTNLAETAPDTLWTCYMQLVFVEEAFRTLKGDLAMRPVYHQLARRIEAHLFIAFLAFCLHTTLRQKLKAHASGLTPRVVMEKLAQVQLVDLRIPTTDGRELLLVRRSEVEAEARLLFGLLKIELPMQAVSEIRNPKLKAM